MQIYDTPQYFAVGTHTYECTFYYRHFELEPNYEVYGVRSGLESFVKYRREPMDTYIIHRNKTTWSITYYVRVRVVVAVAALSENNIINDMLNHLVMSENADDIFSKHAPLMDAIKNNYINMAGENYIADLGAINAGFVRTYLALVGIDGALGSDRFQCNSSPEAMDLLCPYLPTHPERWATWWLYLNTSPKAVGIINSRVHDLDYDSSMRSNNPDVFQLFVDKLDPVVFGRVHRVYASGGHLWSLADNSNAFEIKTYDYARICADKAALHAELLQVMYRPPANSCL